VIFRFRPILLKKSEYRLGPIFLAPWVRIAEIPREGRLRVRLPLAVPEQPLAAQAGSLVFWRLPSNSSLPCLRNCETSSSLAQASRLVIVAGARPTREVFDL
jgi:hypothetical protein